MTRELPPPVEAAVCMFPQPFRDDYVRPWARDQLAVHGFGKVEVAKALAMAFALDVDVSKSDDLYSLDEYITATLAETYDDDDDDY